MMAHAADGEFDKVTVADIRAAFDGLPALVAILDGHGTIVGTNASWQRAASHHPGARLGAGTNYLDVCLRAKADRDTDADRALTGIQSVLSGAAASFAMEYRCEGVRDLWSEMRVTRLASPANGAVVAHWDITRHKEGGATTRAGTPTDQAAAGLRSLSELSAAIVHEIKQPLTAIRANAEAARRSCRDGGTRGLVPEALADIVREVARVSDALDALKAVYEKPPSPGAVDLGELIDELARDFSSWEAAAEVGLRLDLDRSSARVQGTTGQLRQVLRNVLANAVDATSENDGDRLVTISTSAEPQARAVLVRVVDNGGGVRDDVGEHVFAPFFSTKRTGGGMGLALTRAIVDGLGGTIVIYNAADRGAVVEIRLRSIPS